MENNIFEQASREKLRFGVRQGQVATEDLWDLSLPALDTLAKTLNKEVKDSSETSFIKKKSTADATAQLKFDVVFSVITTKLAEAEAAATAADKKARKAKLLELIDSKENEALGGKSIEDLKKELAEL